MLLSELVALFLTKYKMECTKRNVPRMIIPEPEINIYLSEAVSDIQKTFGVIETLLSIPIVVGSSQYALTASVMTVKDVVLGFSPLEKKSTAWIQSQIAIAGLPVAYSIIYSSAIPKLWVYPTPVDTGDIIINYNPNFNYYSPSSIVEGDFGDYGIHTVNQYYGNTTLPSQYDKILLLGMLKQIFPDLEVQYMKEFSLLRVKQFNGEKFTYKMN